ncbi:hypothetical protein BJ165DRAFT_1521527 [Panaeolus papilionaceus]|nr:hypothetical protein BJ165DRAFT_1521527 [Panaeolus papilionaceus]
MAAHMPAGLRMTYSDSIERTLPKTLLKSSQPGSSKLKSLSSDTPIQKLKFNFPIGEPWTQPFVTLLNGETEEIILRKKEQLGWSATTI